MTPRVAEYIALRQQGLTWAAIADRFGIKKSTALQSVKRYTDPEWRRMRNDAANRCITKRYRNDDEFRARHLAGTAARYAARKAAQ